MNIDVPPVTECQNTTVNAELPENAAEMSLLLVKLILLQLKMEKLL